MRPERLIVALLLLLLTAGLAWAAAGLFRQGRAAASPGPYLGSVACGLGAAFLGLWAVTLLAA